MSTKKNTSSSSKKKDFSSRNFNLHQSITFKDKIDYTNDSKHLRKISSHCLFTSANCSKELIDKNIEYDNYISSLKKQLFLLKQETKQKQIQINSIRVRLNILHSQEEESLNQLQKIKEEFKKMKRNKLQNEKINVKKYKYSKNNNCLSQNYLASSSNFKNLKLSNKSLKNYNLGFYISNNEKQIISDEMRYIPKTNINNNINILINGENHDNEIEQFQKMLIQQINDDEMKKQSLQDEITKIEQEEEKILINLHNSFNNIKINK